jgi:nifR3 family TIM-barrel protein
MVRDVRPNEVSGWDLSFDFGAPSCIIDIKYKRYLRSMTNFWKSLQRPIIGLAPMHSVTDSLFRLRCKKAGADIVYSEMIAAEAVIRRVVQAFKMMQFSKAERPILIQIFGSNPVSMTEAAKIIEREIKPDGIDINFGCPVQKAAKQGFGAIQLNDGEKAAQIVRTITGAVKLPISVKMRLVSKIPQDTIDFIREIEKAGVTAVAIHARTQTQKYHGHADWELLHKIKKELPELIILGSGDIESPQDLKDKLGNLDGALVGRAAKRDPQIFLKLKNAGTIPYSQ